LWTVSLSIISLHVLILLAAWGIRAMVTSQELAQIPLFELLSPVQREKISRTAADLRVRAGEWLAQEGDIPSFFVVLEGSVEFLKKIGGVTEPMIVYEAEEFFGEVPLLLGARVLVGLRARVDSRILRIDRSQFLELITESRCWSDRILGAMATRVRSVQETIRRTRTERVVLIGDEMHAQCRGILTFLSRCGIPYCWIDRTFDIDRLPENLLIPTEGLVAIVDGQKILPEPTESEMAEALGIQTTPYATAYDVVIIGAGPAGLAAAVCGSSEGLKVLIVEQATPGGQAGTSSRIENYLGFPGGISGDELSDRALCQARRFGAEIVITRRAERIDVTGEEKTVTLNEGLKVRSRSVVLATGVDWRLLDADGIEKMIGHGVVYGASRTEAMAVIGKHIFIVGGGNSAGQAAIYFSGYAAGITMIVRGNGLAQSMSQYLVAEIEKKTNIRVEAHTEVTSVNGVFNLEAITTADRKTGDIKTRKIDALFVMIGAKTDTAWLPVEMLRDEHGYVCTGGDAHGSWPLLRSPYPLETTVPGIFCAGDVRHGSIKRVASGVGEGSTAITFVHQYLALSNQLSSLELFCHQERREPQDDVARQAAL
jgi:thioredoxin reductase (NADPH)